MTISLIQQQSANHIPIPVCIIHLGHILVKLPLHPSLSLSRSLSLSLTLLLSHLKRKSLDAEEF